MSNTAAGRMSDDVRVPVEGAYAASAAPYGRDGVFRKLLTTASVPALIPDHWKGRYVDFTCDGGTGFYLLFGATGLTIVTPTTKESTIAAEVITFVTGTAKKIEPGTTKSYLIPDDATITHFAWFGVSAAGYIEAVCSTGLGTGS